MDIQKIATAFIDFLKGLMQPIITFVAVAILFRLVSGGYDPDKLFALAGGVLLFWFGYTAIKNFNFNGKNEQPPKVDGGQVKSTATAVNNTVSAVEDEEVSFDTWDGKPPIPFDKEAFMAEVNRDVPGQRHEVNKCTTFYEARDKVSGVAAPWKFNNVEALRDAWTCIAELVDEAFEEIWGVDFQTANEHLNDDLGCTTCVKRTCTYPDIDFKARQMGMAYYYILRDYRDVHETLESLK